MTSLGVATDRILRAQTESVGSALGRREWGRIATLLCLYGMMYGAVMGSYGGVAAARGWQLLYSATKVPLLLLGTMLICVPSFFVFNSVAGLRSDFPAAVRALLTAQAGMTIALCSLAPFTALWYYSVSNYDAAVLFNGVAFLLGSIGAQLILRRLYRPLIERDPKHRLLLRSWLILYAFVGTQLAWLLRPFVGQPDAPVQWFRAEAWGNAYVEVGRHLLNLVSSTR